MSGDPAKADDRRNEWAQIRTDLANERTLLAYGRTSLMMVASGATILKFFGTDKQLLIVGIGLIALGVIFAGFGLIRFRTYRRRIG